MGANAFAAQSLPAPVSAPSPAPEDRLDRFFRAVDTAETEEDIIRAMNAGENFTVTNLWTQIGTIVNWVVGLVGIAALVFLMYGAYMYMSAGQNEDNLKKAKASVTYGIIGAVVAVLAFSIFAFAKSLLGAP